MSDWPDWARLSPEAEAAIKARDDERRRAITRPEFDVRNPRHWQPDHEFSRDTDIPVHELSKMGARGLIRCRIDQYSQQVFMGDHGRALEVYGSPDWVKPTAGVWVALPAAEAHAGAGRRAIHNWVKRGRVRVEPWGSINLYNVEDILRVKAETGFRRGWPKGRPRKPKVDN